MNNQEKITDLIAGELNKKLEGKMRDEEIYLLARQIYFTVKDNKNLLKIGGDKL